VEISGLIWRLFRCCGFELDVQQALLVGAGWIEGAFEEEDMAGFLRVLFAVCPVGWLSSWLAGSLASGLSVCLSVWLAALICGCVRISIPSPGRGSDESH